MLYAYAIVVTLCSAVLVFLISMLRVSLPIGRWKELDG